MPAASRLCAQPMLSSSSNRALSSTNTETSLPCAAARRRASAMRDGPPGRYSVSLIAATRSEEHTSELQSRLHLVCRLLLEKKKKNTIHTTKGRQHDTTCE